MASTSIRNIFILETPYEEDKEEFYKFMEKNAKGFFSSVGNVRYRVDYLRVKSVINKGRKNNVGAKDRVRWQELASNLNYKQRSKNNYQNYHKSVITKMLIDQSGGSYIKLMNLIDQYLKDFHKNDWKFNVVKYTYQEQNKTSGNFVIYN